MRDKALGARAATEGIVFLTRNSRKGSYCVFIYNEVTLHSYIIFTSSSTPPHKGLWVWSEVKVKIQAKYVYQETTHVSKIS